MIRLLKAVFSVLLVSSAVFAGDLTITMNTKSSGFMGRSSASVETHYYTAKFMRSNNPTTQMDTLVDYGTMTTYIINHKKKTIEKMSMDDVLAMRGRMRPGTKESAPAMGQVQVSQEGSDIVAGHACVKYKVMMGGVVMELSNDPSLQRPMPEASYQRMLQMRASVPAGPNSTHLAAELSKIKGMTLKTHMTGMMGMDTLQEATSVKEGAISASVFALPEGYRMEDLGAKMKAMTGKRP